MQSLQVIKLNIQKEIVVFVFYIKNKLTKCLLMRPACLGNCAMNVAVVKEYQNYVHTEKLIQNGTNYEGGSNVNQNLFLKISIFILLAL